MGRDFYFNLYLLSYSGSHTASYPVVLWLYPKGIK